MTDMTVKLPRLKGGIPAEQIRQEMDEEAAALPPATPEALEAAFELVGNEIVRCEVWARRAGDDTYAQRLMVGLGCLLFAQSTMKETMLLNDFLRDAEDLCEELAELPPSDPDIDDAWVLKDE